MGTVYSEHLPRIEADVLKFIVNNPGFDHSIWLTFEVDPTTMYGKIVNVRNMVKSYRQAMSGKMKFKKGATIFSHNWNKELISTYVKLLFEVYYPYRYDVFNLDDGKKRAIAVPPFPDKVVHHMVNNVLLPYFGNIFIPDSYACIKGKGSTKAVIQIQNYQKQSIQEYGKDCMFLKLDISKFFYNIDQDILKELFRKHIKCISTCNLLEHIVYGYTEKKGLPLGNLISQLFANIYMHEFDLFVKHRLKIKYYVRYADDIFIFCPNKLIARDWLKQCIYFANDRLRLTIPPGKCGIYQPDRIPGLGYMIYPTHLELLKKSKDSFKKFLNNRDLKRLNSWYNSARYASCYNFILKYIKNTDIEFNPDNKIPFTKQTHTESYVSNQCFAKIYNNIEIRHSS